MADEQCLRPDDEQPDSLTAGKRILSYSYVVVVVGLVESVETRALAHGPSDLGC